MSNGTKLIAQNKKARFDYSIDEDYECGIELKGTEVKSIKDGTISFPDAFAEIQQGEVWLKTFIFLSIHFHPFLIMILTDQKNFYYTKKKLNGFSVKQKKRALHSYPSMFILKTDL